jgi:type I restriction enzyme S subunit
MTMSDESINLPEGWEWSTANEVCSSVRDGTHDTPKYYEQGIPLVTSKNLKGGEIDFSTTRLISLEDHQQISIRSGVDEGDILFAMIGTIGNPIVVSKNRDFSIKNIGLFKKNEDVVDSHYLRLWFLSPTFNQLLDKKALVKGTTQKFVPLANLRVFPIPLPPIAEQKRIVAKIEELRSKTQKAREALEAIPEMCDRFRQSVLAAAFRGDLTADWREENSDVEPALALLERIREKRQIYQLSYKKRKVQAESSNPSFLELPENWTVAYPEDLCSPDNYSIGIGPFGSNLKVSDYTNSGVPLIFVRHIRANNFKELDPKFISFDKAAELAPHIVKPLDLLITKMGDPPGDCEVYPEDQSEGVITSDCLKFRVWRDFLNNDYFKYCIDSIYVKKQLGLITRGVAQQKISVERFKSISLPLAPLDEQIEIVQRITKAFGAINLIQQQYEAVNAQLEKLDRAILAKAFRGELVAQDPNDEPALVLLERIREERAKVSDRKSTKRKK